MSPESLDALGHHLALKNGDVGKRDYQYSWGNIYFFKENWESETICFLLFKVCFNLGKSGTLSKTV